jgi:hypothetical protein
MKVRLDEIEKTLAQLSPRRLKTDSPVEEAPPGGQQHLAPPNAPMMNSAVFPPSPSVSSFDQSIRPPKSVSLLSVLLYISDA